MRSREFNARRLDVFAFAEAAGLLEGHAGLGDLPRWAELRHPDIAPPNDAEPVVTWSAQAELRQRRAAAPEVWLHLQAEGALPMTCQRCLGPVEVPMQVERWFRFVDSEQEAARLDEDAEDDVLVLHQAFDLIALIEDELLLDAPIVPRHDACPDGPSFMTDDEPPSEPDATDTPADAGNADESGEGRPRKHPFAALAGLRDQLKKG